MGLRFRKSIKIAPGVKINFNKKSISATVGTRGAHYTVNSKGKRTASVGMPGTGISYTETLGGNNHTKANPPHNSQPTLQTTPPGNKNNKGCLFWIIAFFAFCFALALYSFMWIPGIIAIIFFAVKKSDVQTKKKRLLISGLVTITSFLVFIWIGSDSNLQSINADFGKDTFDINETVEIKITTTPEDAEIESLKLSENSIAKLEYKDGKAILHFTNTGNATLFLTANETIQSNAKHITVIDKEAEEKKKAEEEAARKAEEEKLAAEKAEQERIATEQAEQERLAAEQAAAQPQEPMVWIPASGSKYHSNSSCSGMNNPTQVTLSKAQSMGYEPCKRCH